MNRDLVTPEHLQDFVGGERTTQADGVLAPGASIFGLRFPAGAEAVVPALRDFLLVAHRTPTATMHECVGTGWREDRFVRGEVSFFPRAEQTHWRWDDELDLLHLHLRPDLLLDTSRAMFEADIEDVELRSTTHSAVPAIYPVIGMLAKESSRDRAGNHLIIESLLTQLAVFVLRDNAGVVLRERRAAKGLSAAQLHTVREYVVAHLDGPITLEDLAGSVFLSRYHFLRQFREATNLTPHEFVTTQRVERAARLLRRTSLPIREIAAACGFSDQSHLTRVFSRRQGVTPARYRN